MSGERDLNRTAETVESTVEALKKLCAVAFLKYASQLQKIDATTASQLKEAKDNENTANSEIDDIIKKKINAVSPDFSLKEKTDIRSQLRNIITDKQLKKLPLSVKEQDLLTLYRIEKLTLEVIKGQVDILAAANNILFSSPMVIPKPTDESRAIRQMLLSHITFDILNRPNDLSKTERIVHWIKVLDAMLDQGIYYGAHAVMSALNDPKINKTNVDEEMLKKLSNAVNLFGATKESKSQLEQAVRIQFKNGQRVVPSLHSVDSASNPRKHREEFLPDRKAA